MQYNTIEILKGLKIVKTTNKFYKLLEKTTNKHFKLDTPVCLLPFGLESYKFMNKTNYIIKLEINENGKNFEKCIIDFEDTILKIMSNINKKDYIKESQIIFSEKFNSKLIVKIKCYFNKIITKVKDNNTEISIFDLKKLLNIKVNISPNIFINGNKLIVKWSANIIKIA